MDVKSGAYSSRFRSLAVLTLSLGQKIMSSYSTQNLFILDLLHHTKLVIQLFFGSFEKVSGIKMFQINGSREKHV